MIIRMQGKIGRKMRPILCMIEWEDESFNRFRVPEEFLKYVPGTHFRAIVERDDRDFSLKQILSCERFKPSSKPTLEEMRQFLESISTPPDASDGWS